MNEELLDSILDELEHNYDGNMEKFCEDKSLDEVEELYNKIVSQYSFKLPGNHNFTNMSYTNVRQDYVVKLMTTGLIGYLFRCLDEYKVPRECEHVSVEEYVKNPAIIDPMEYDLKDSRKMEKHAENKKWMEIKINIYEFLMDRFSFNPDKHVRIGYWPNEDDPERNPVTTKAAVEGIKAGNSVRTKKGKLKGTKYSKLTREKLRTRVETKQEEVTEEEWNNKSDIERTQWYNEHSKLVESMLDKSEEDQKLAKKIIADQGDSDELDTIKNVTEQRSGDHESHTVESLMSSDSEESDDDEEEYDSGYPKGSTADIIRSVLPAADYFYHFNRYFEKFYEPLRKGTTDLYAEKDDMDIAFAIWEQHENIEEANIFRNKHKNDTPHTIHTIQNNRWVFTGPWEQNKERMECYNKNTGVMTSMLDKNIEDNKLVEDMVHNRVRIAKEENVAETGPPDEAAMRYFSSNKPEAAKLGAVNINSAAYADNYDSDDNVKKKKKKKKRKPKKKIPIVKEEDALEIVVHNLTGGGKSYSKRKMYTRAEEPDLKEVNIKKSGSR